MKSIPIIDTHVHFWNPGQIKYDWLESSPPLNRSFLPSDFNEASQGIAIDKMVFVECDCHPKMNEREVEWVEKLAAADGRIKGIVAHVDLTDGPKMEADIERITSHPLVRGIRHNIQFNEPGFALQEAFVDGVKKVLESGHHFELCITHDQMDECIELMHRLPKRPIILDHCGKPGIRDGEINRWAENLRKLSEFDQLHCKISGLLTEADHDNWTENDITPYMDHVRSCFGIDRILYGGDWPVCTLAGGYQKWYTLVSDWTKNWSESDTFAFYRDNAIKFYRMSE